MRPIKFRAWNKRYKEMFPVKCIDWQEGLVYLDIPDGEEGCDSWAFTYKDKQVDYSVVLEQFTGLLDKNGKEIWEGDILSKTQGSHNRVVKFGKGQFEIGKGQPLWTWECSCEIIGNIHENPELLEK